MKPENCKNCCNKSCLFNGVDSSNWILQSHFQRGESIFSEKKQVNGLYVVKNGLAKEFSNHDNHFDQSSFHIKDGDLFGYIDFKGEKHLRNAAAINDSTVCIFTKDSLHQLCLSNVDISLKLIRFFAAELSKSDYRSKLGFSA